MALRLDGVLQTIETIDPELGPLVIGRIKYLAKLKTYEHSLPQDGRINLTDSGIDQELRVSTYPTVAGEKIVIRFFSEQAAPHLSELGIDLHTLERIQNFLDSGRGLMLLTGPSGSGKTTTIYACLSTLLQGTSRHIITVEDPVERIIPGIMQTEVNEARGLDYPKAIRHLLRQDPEIIVIGEIRDDETADIVIRAALTGHQVIATLHAGSCHAVIDRLRLMVKDTFAIATVLDLIVNQRLVRKLCPSCTGNGCGSCQQTGYQGRTPLVETLSFADEDRKQLRQGETPAATPSPTLNEAAERLMARGVTNESEIARCLGS